MNRLLHRLASRARGAAPEIRPIVGWHAPAGYVDGVPQVQASQPIEPPAAAAASPAPPAAAWRTATSQADAGARAADAGATHGRRVPAASADDPRPARRRDEAAASATSFADAQAAATGPLEMTFAVAAAPLATDAEQPHGAGAGEAAAMQARLAPPEPLLAPPRPAVSSALPRPANAIRGTAPNAPARAAEDVTEVHVTIGRIELTAVHEAPRPRRESARARGPQSLDEYLARREAKRR